MVEDSLANLVSAKRLGMKTVWVSTGLRQSPFVDVEDQQRDGNAETLRRL